MSLAAEWSSSADVAAVEAAADRIFAAGVAVQRMRPLGPLTTFGIGGPARVFVQPVDTAELQSVLTALAPTAVADVPLLVVGKGSNLLVADAGFDGVALRLGAGFKWFRREGDVVHAGAGEAMPALASWLAREGLAGLEFAAGIPATVGGSVRMNAGAHGGDTAAGLVSAQLATPDRPTPVSWSKGMLAFGYRQSTLPTRAVVVSASWHLQRDSPTEIRARLDELRAWRRSTQPLRHRNCGSVFTNPPGDSAGRLIEAAGLKGHRVGGASVSTKHANFIVVEPDARARDVVRLIAAVRRRVLRDGGPDLQPEVRLIGAFG